jgi:hypothetical protein
MGQQYLQFKGKTVERAVGLSDYSRFVREADETCTQSDSSVLLKVRILLEAEAKVNTRDAAGKTALAYLEDRPPRDGWRQECWAKLRNMLVARGATQ